MRTRESLVRAAAEVFAEAGFAPATISSICGRAGVSNGALHFHFESKRALAQAVEAAALDTVRRVTREADERRGGPLQRLIDATHGLMSSLEEDVMVRAGLALADTAPRPTGAVELRGEWLRWVDAVLRTAEREGRLAEGVRPAQVSNAVVAATVGFAVLGCGNPTWVSRRTLCRYWELMLPRLAPPDALAQLVPQGTGPGVPGQVQHHPHHRASTRLRPGLRPRAALKDG
ncbi:ScbR family autoregulator-binding transcription factor [Streptomyces sp. NPDC052236]|uniref:ScbR family autoregulator-binding transcription factor n=1 Tax=Streptomyces sp. NPDC052236 TaxID=3365686 RepID=UPI0037D00EDA